MPRKNDIKLDILTKNYKLADNRSITVWDIKSPEDAKFYFQLRFEQNKNKINLKEIKDNLIASIKKLTYSNKIEFNKKLEFLQYFTNLGFDLKSTAIIKKKIIAQEESSQALFKLDDYKQNVIQVFDKDVIDLFVLDTLTKDSKIYYLSYEIPKDITKNNAPLCSISIYTGKKLSEKIYLFPTNSLKKVITALKNSEAINLENLNIPYVRNSVPYNQNKSHNQDIQTRINLQTIISEILTHLEKPKCFRKEGSKKVKIFRTLSETIAKGENLSTISNDLNAHDSWKVFAQHRDPWGFLSFFKGKTHSLMAWKALKNEISNSEHLSPQTLLI